MAQRPVRQERAERTRAALIQAAAEVFGELGYSGASVMKIADRAGVTLGAMYFHFRNKEELARQIVSGQPEFVDPPLDSTGLQRVVDITLTWAHKLATEPVLQAGARLVWEQEQFVPIEENSHRQWSEILLVELRVAESRRELRAGTEIGPLSRLLVNACTGAQMHSSVESHHADLPQRIEEMWRCLLPAIATPGAARTIDLDAARGGAG